MWLCRVSVCKENNQSDLHAFIKRCKTNSFVRERGTSLWSVTDRFK